MFPDPPWELRRDDLRDWLRNPKQKCRVGFTTNKRIQARRKKVKRKKMRK